MKIFDNNNLNDIQRNFNRKIKGVRQIIERCIGVMKARFRCLLAERELRYHPTKVGHIIYACATLHNFLIANRFDIFHDIDQDLLENLLNRPNQGNIEELEDEREAALRRRNQLANFLYEHLRVE